MRSDSLPLCVNVQLVEIDGESVLRALWFFKLFMKVQRDERAWENISSEILHIASWALHDRSVGSLGIQEFPCV